MPYDGADKDRDDDDRYGWEPPRETMTHDHPSLPFIAIEQSRYADAAAGDERFEEWRFCIWGPGGETTYPAACYYRGDATEHEMLATLADQAEKFFLHERGSFFVLRIYLETGQYRREIDAVMRKHGQWPLWRRAEAAVTRRLGVQRSAIRMRY
jgi:hypothetical protein